VLVDVIAGVATNNLEAMSPVLSLFCIPTDYHEILGAIVNLFNRKNSLLVKSTKVIERYIEVG
jgi:hypothetical protein